MRTFQEAVTDQKVNLRPINVFGYDKENKATLISTTTKARNTIEAVNDYKASTKDWKAKYIRIEAYFADGK